MCAFVSYLWSPTDHIAHSMSFKPPPVILSPNGKLLSEVVTDFTEKVFQQERRVLDHQENFGVAGANLLRGLACYYSKCRNDTEKLMNLNLPMGFQEAFHELYNYSSTPPQAEGVSLIDVNSFGKCDEGPATDPFIVKNTPEDVQGEIINNTYALKLSVPVSKRNEKRFYLNELNFINANYVQYSGRVRYASYSPWDCKIIKIPTVCKNYWKKLLLLFFFYWKNNFWGFCSLPHNIMCTFWCHMRKVGCTWSRKGWSILH